MITVAYAASSQTSSTTVAELVDKLIDNSQQAILPLIVGAAFVTFLWGVARYLRSAGDERSRKEGILYIWCGLLGLVVIFGVWAFVGLLSGLLGKEVGIPQLGD
jgi:predicted PurR-regulated permease PerM